MSATCRPYPARVPTRKRVLTWLGVVALVATAVVTLRVTEDSHNSDTDSDDRPRRVVVERYAADNVVLPAPSRRPAPPERLAVSTEDGALRVSWADGLADGAPPRNAAGYDVRWREDGGQWRTRLVATPDVRLDGLRNGRRYRVEVRTVDAFGQRSAPTAATGKPARPRTPWRAALTGLYDDFAHPERYAERWHLAGYRGCVDVVAERGDGLPIELGCGADVAVLRARQPMTLTAPNADGELGRVAVRTDTAGAGGELTISFVPGPADRIGTESRADERFPERNPALPGGTVQVGIDDDGVHVATAPDVPTVPTGQFEVTTAPARGPGVAHLFEVAVTTSGIRVYQDGRAVAVAGVRPSWTSASVLFGFRGPERRRSRVHVTAAGFSGPAVPAPPVVEVPVVAGTQRVLDPTERAPELGIARTPLRTATAARLVATISVADGMDPRAVVAQFGATRVPARPVVAAPATVAGAAVTVVADVPAALLGPAGADSITPLVLRAPGATRQVRLVETYLEITPAEGTRPAPAPLKPAPRRVDDMLPTVAAVLCNSAGEPLNSSVVPNRGQVVLQVDLAGATNQWETGSIAGVQGFQVWLDGHLIAAVPTRSDGPGLGGRHAMSIATAGLASGGHVLEVREHATGGEPEPVSAVLSFTVR